MAESAVKRRQGDLPGTRFSIPLFPPISLPGTRLSTADSTQTQSQSQPQSSSPSLPGSSISISSTVASTSDPTSTMTTFPGSRLSLSDTSSPTGTSVPMQSFNFATIPYPTTCTASTFNWTYTGPSQAFDLAVSSSIAPHTDFLPPSKRQGQTNQLPIAFHVDATAQTWTWGSVNIPAGWYTLQAIGDGWSAVSPQFFVVNGTDTSCLGQTSQSSSSSTVATSNTATSTSSTTSVTSSSTILPVTAAVSSRSHTGAIVGGVIGGVIILAAAIAAYIYFGLCRRTPTRSRRRAMGDHGRGPAQLGKWGGLSSLDSGMDAPVAAARPGLVMAIPSKKRGKTDSTGAILSPLSSTAHGHSSAARGTSDEDVATLAEEKAVPYTKAYEYIETVQPLAHANRRRSSTSTSGAGLSPITEPLPSAGSNGRARARSSSQSHRAMALAKLDGDDPAPAPSSRARSPTVPRRSFDAPPMAMPASPPYDVSPMNRSSSGGGPGARRAVRKPVPQLDASELSLPPTPTSAGVSMSRGQSVASTVTYGSTSPLTSASAHPMYRHESQSSGTLRASVLVPGRQHSREDLEAAGMELPNLNHKSSFGDRPVHYLIPDMPPPPPRR